MSSPTPDIGLELALLVAKSTADRSRAAKKWSQTNMQRLESALRADLHTGQDHHPAPGHHTRLGALGGFALALPDAPGVKFEGFTPTKGAGRRLLKRTASLPALVDPGTLVGSFGTPVQQQIAIRKADYVVDPCDLSHAGMRGLLKVDDRLDLEMLDAAQRHRPKTLLDEIHEEPCTPPTGTVRV
mmetsp:Transcript_28189/g.68157  ORF Transcript_28189/g.68157 Transcript_28189/m.68157 type:complete len:185 (+) Transcript_28189:24-578(+)